MKFVKTMSKIIIIAEEKEVQRAFQLLIEAPMQRSEASKLSKHPTDSV